MKPRHVSLGIAVACFAVLPAWSGDAERAAEGRAIAAAFSAELGGVLQGAMAEGGPLAAMRVCQADAPRIARGAGETFGAAVGRTSLKVRNPDNRPDAHERSVLIAFAEAVERGGDTPLERLETLDDGRQRFMSAILVHPPCLVCHGEDLAAPVARKIEELYPGDEARGYRLGELRGAFTITWPRD
jgi:hypothetical protein